MVSCHKFLLVVVAGIHRSVGKETSRGSLLDQDAANLMALARLAPGRKLDEAFITREAAPRSKRASGRQRRQIRWLATLVSSDSRYAVLRRIGHRVAQQHRVRMAWGTEHLRCRSDFDES